MQNFTVQGRIVWGHPGKLQAKKDKNRQTVMKDGKPVEQCAFGLAIPKQMFDQQPLASGMTIRQHLEAEVRTAFPNGTPQSFAWKFKDGDGVDHMGKPFNTREGHAGHYILTIATQGFAPQIFKSNGQGGWVQMNANEIKCGDFVAVDLSVKYNGATGTLTPGLYVNPNGVLFLGYGQEITSGSDPDEMFGGFQAAQFQGMSAQPQMPQGGAMPSGMGNAYAPAAGAMPQGGMPNAGIAAPAPNSAPMNPQYGQAPQYPAQPQAGQGYAPQQPAPLPPPAHDFVQAATGGYPAPQAGYAPAPQQPQPAYGATPMQPAYGAAPQGAYPAQPMQPVAGAYPSNQAPQQAGAPGYPGMPAGR